MRWKSADESLMLITVARLIKNVVVKAFPVRGYFYAFDVYTKRLRHSGDSSFGSSRFFVG